MTGKDRRLKHEYDEICRRFDSRKDINIAVTGRNAAGIPNHYQVVYEIRSVCSVTDMEHLNTDGFTNEPIYADRFVMDIDIPPQYPSIDAQPRFTFLTTDESGKDIPHPWHPNIRWFGAFAGRVCINMADTYTDIAWAVARIAQYLRYECYHAVNEPPYPEDMKVAEWVLRNL